MFLGIVLKLYILPERKMVLSWNSQLAGRELCLMWEERCAEFIKFEFILKLINITELQIFRVRLDPGPCPGSKEQYKGAYGVERCWGFAFQPHSSHASLLNTEVALPEWCLEKMFFSSWIVGICSLGDEQFNACTHT